jgi:hypothetical protein
MRHKVVVQTWAQTERAKGRRLPFEMRVDAQNGLIRQVGISAAVTMVAAVVVIVEVGRFDDVDERFEVENVGVENDDVNVRVQSMDSL